MQNLFINIREATINDLPAIMQIEGLCFPHGAWREENILYELKDNPVSHFWVIELALNEGDPYQGLQLPDQSLADTQPGVW